MRSAFLGCLILAACGDNLPASGVAIIDNQASWAPAIDELVKLTPADISLSGDAAFTIILEFDPAVGYEGFLLEQAAPDVWKVHANDVLGAQYGAAAALENLGIRFHHPYDPEVPAKLAFAPTTPIGVLQQPEVRVRGLHLHTLHPVEPYFAMWEPGPGNQNDAHRIIDWVIKNRGNYVQWAALNNIDDPAEHAAWQTYTRELIDYAHLRGIRVGLNIQLFGQSNLQQAFDLSEDRTGTVPIADEVAAKLPLVTTGVPFDVYDLSFGEFFGAAPDKFIAAVDEVQKQLAAVVPNAEMHAIVHDGATQRVTYMGQDLIYYFLVKFASPRIVPDIHTVMYYDMFEDAGGAYHHADFHEHLAYLEERMCAKQRAAYHPEDAYWVAFDNSVPQWFPLYIRSRWFDLQQLKARPCWPLDEHLVFSSGWEWGYWMNDVASLRASYRVPASADALVRETVPAGMADLVDAVIDIQHTALIDQHLAAYLASRDIAIDTGRSIGIVSQPDRVTFDDLVATPTLAPSFTTDVIDPLAQYAAALEELVPPTGDRWVTEIADGLAIDTLRAKFVLAAYRAVLAHLAGDGATATAQYATATDLATAARAIVASRHAVLHDASPLSSATAGAAHGRLTGRTPNKTYYQYGYLENADTSCFWQRELAQVGGILGDTSVGAPPGCLF